MCLITKQSQWSFFKHINILFSYTALTCDTEEPLMGGSNPIPDSHMTASSVFNTQCLPNFARLHGQYAWSASQAELDAPVPNLYIQVN